MLPRRSRHPLEENYVRLFVLESIPFRQPIGIEIADPVVVVLLPTTSGSVLDQTDVVPACQGGADVSHDRISVVHVRWSHAGLELQDFGPVSFGGILSFFQTGRRKHKRFQVESLQRKLDRSPNLSCALRMAGGKSLEVYDQKSGGPCDRDLLGGLSFLLAMRAFPDLIPRKPLLGTVRSQAIPDIAHT